MSYIGKTPTSVPLTSSDITDGIITTTKIADANVTNPKLTSGSQKNFRNIIINGDMSIAQRGTSFTSVTSNTYTLDRWLTSGTGYTLTITQDTDVPTGQGFAKSNKLQVTTANTSPSAGQSLQYQTRLEGQMLQYLKFGTSSAESLTMCFWVKSNLTGVYCTEFQNDDNDKTRGANFTISSADTWEKKTITISGDTASGFTNDNNRSMRLSFGLMSGSNTTGSNASIANWVTRSTNVTSIFPNLGVNFCSSTSNYINITGVQLEAGTTASDFEFLPFDVNRQRCYRYYRTLVPLNTENTGFSMGFYTANNNGRFAMHLENPMRTTPTLDIVTGTDYFKIFTAGGGDDELNSFSIMANSTERFVIANNTSQASGTGGQAGYVQSSSNSAYLGLEAEL